MSEPASITDSKSGHQSWLRVAVLIAAGLGTLFWLGTLVQWWRISGTRRDGFELIGVLLSSGLFVVAVLPALALGFTGRWLVFAAILSMVALALYSDAMWNWLPW